MKIGKGSGEATRIRYELRLLNEPPVTYVLGTFDIDATPQLNWPLIPVGTRYELVKVPLP